MISLDEIARSLYGAYRLALLDSRGMSYFDKSIDGFWQSFVAALLIAPFFIMLMFVKADSTSVELSIFRFITIESIAYVVGWVLFPLLMFYISQKVDREKQYITFIVAYNWCAVIQNALYLPFALTFELNIISDRNIALINFILLCFIMTYIWFITKTALETNYGFASAIVLLDIGLWIMLNLTTESMLIGYS